MVPFLNLTDFYHFCTCIKFLISSGSSTLSCTCALKHSWVTVTVPLGEGLHHSVDLLSFARQPEAPKELSKGLNQVQVCELMQLQKGV